MSSYAWLGQSGEKKPTVINSKRRRYLIERVCVCVFVWTQHSSGSSICREPATQPGSISVLKENKI